MEYYEIFFQLILILGTIFLIFYILYKSLIKQYNKLEVNDIREVLPELEIYPEENKMLNDPLEKQEESPELIFDDEDGYLN